MPHVVAACRQFCLAQGMGPLLAAHVATAASELANNLWMHASEGGRISLKLVSRPAGQGVALMADDDGPGIPDLAAAMRDGFSTGGGMGCGLPGVQRLMDDFQIESRPGGGTHVLCHKWAKPVLHAPWPRG